MWFKWGRGLSNKVGCKEIFFLFISSLSLWKNIFVFFWTKMRAKLGAGVYLEKNLQIVHFRLKIRDATSNFSDFSIILNNHCFPNQPL